MSDELAASYYLSAPVYHSTLHGAGLRTRQDMASPGQCWGECVEDIVLLCVRGCVGEGEFVHVCACVCVCVCVC